MRLSLVPAVILALSGFPSTAQDPVALDPSGFRQALSAERDKAVALEANPRPMDAGKEARESPPGAPLPEAALEERQRRRRDDEIQAMRARDNQPPRFASDLFEVRQRLGETTEGGVSDDYVLGVGDQIQVVGYGSASFEVPAAVDGRGMVVIPRVGTVKVSGMPLGQAKSALQHRVSQFLAGTHVDVAVTRLREVRVFVLGEVYQPGSYVVPSLASILNVLSLAGGPGAKGSYRDIRIVRGGQVIHQVDLYPLRSQGLGNMNFLLQSGDLVFVPLAFNQVTLQGAFSRLEGPWRPVSSFREGEPRPGRAKDSFQASNPPRTDERDVQGTGRRRIDGPDFQGTGRRQAGGRDLQDSLASPAEEDLEADPGVAGRPRPEPSRRRDGTAGEERAPRDWRERAPAAPRMVFEMLPGETAQDAFDLAGGLAPGAYLDCLTLRRTDALGAASVREIPLGQLAACALDRGDQLLALERRERRAHMVEVKGWARVPGTFSRSDGLRVGDLLRRQGQVMPDTYLGHGEIVRTLPDGNTRYLPFAVGQAVHGDPSANLLLEDRDVIELFRTDRMRLRRTVSLSGPFTRAGTFDFHPGMRASDLLFQAGIPDKAANTLEAELARSRDGQQSQVIRLDLARLASTEASSPVALTDDAVNPPLQEDDVISVFEKPEFKIHRLVRVMGEVRKPGRYALDARHTTLSTLLLDRAGGLTPRAMPAGGMLLRDVREQGLEGLDGPGSRGAAVAEILDRLNETKLYPLALPGLAGNGAGAARGARAPGLFKLPVLHGLGSANFSRVVVDFQAALAKRADSDLELEDGDTIVIPKQTDTAMIFGEAATPFGFYQVKPGMRVADLMALAGGTTRNADLHNLRLLKVNGRIVDRSVKRQEVEPGDIVLIPQVIRRDSNWQENLMAMTPLAILINALKN